MTVALIPPVSSGGGTWDSVSQPLLEAPRYLRGPGHSRWHRPRSGVRRPGLSGSQGYFRFWCGYQAIDFGDLLGADTVPEPDPVCGPCEGKALGAGVDDAPPGLPRLAFEPRWLDPPRDCPVRKRRSLDLVEWLPGNRVGRCLACGVYAPIRAMGGPYNSYAAITSHRVGPDLFAPCPFHAWNRPALRADGTVGCECGYREDKS